MEYGWPVLIALMATPYIVGTLGPSAYGLLSIVGVTLGLFSVLDLGLGGAATRQIAALFQAERHEDINTVVSTVLAFYLMIGAVGAMGIVLLTNTFVTKWLAMPPDLIATARIAFYVSAPAFMVSLVLSTFAAIPRAMQRYDIASTAAVVLNTLTTLLTVVLLAAGQGLLAIVIAGLAINVAAIPVLVVITRRALPTLRVRARFDPSTFRELMTFGSYFLLSSVGVLILYQADKLLLGSFLGLGAVTFYVVPGALAQRLQGLTAAATNIVFPVSSALFESNAHAALLRLYREGSRLVFAMVVALAVPLAVFAEPFLRHWMGAEFAARSWVAMALLTATYASLSATSMAWGIANGSGRARINAVFTLGIAAANIVLFIWWVRPFGIPGAAAAYLVSAAVGAPLLISYIERHVLKLSGVEFLHLFWRIVLVGVVQTTLGLWLRVWAVNLWVTMALMIVTALLFPLGYWTFGFMQAGDRRLVSLLLQRARGNTLDSAPEA